MADHSRILRPSSLAELFALWKIHPEGVLFAGGIEHIRNQNSRLPLFKPTILSLGNIDELRRISRTERYLEIGAMVRLSQIISLGKIVPEILSLCLESIGGPQLRSQATIGGNLCNASPKLDAAAAMIALDAQYELRTAQSSRWIQASRFSSLPGPPDLGPQEILTRIRVPLDPWNYTWYRKFTRAGSNEPGGGILFIMRNQKNILTHIRVLYSGQTTLREKNSETMLAGKHLPLDRRDALAFVDHWRNYINLYEGNEESVFAGTGMNSNPELEKSRILNFIKTTIMGISD
ncbi:MAG: FAD binding domain-containing protein [Treponema sp.]|nr:FAD binding domain-containing protein [Treponema sp.]